MRHIRLRGVRQNNLRGLDLDLPLHRVICVTGVSGAGKSSLVFDVLYAEGQRRYVETFSTYLRQYLERLPRPLVDEISHIPPAIAVEQTNPVKSSRSTVGTLTEITHFARLLFFRQAVPVCPHCREEIRSLSPEQAAGRLLAAHPGQPAVITALVRAEDPAVLRDGLLAAGYFRVFTGGRVADLEEVGELPPEPEVVLDRLRLSDRARLVEALEQGFRMGEEVRVHLPYGKVERFVSAPRCPGCGFEVPRRSPNLFSFNNPLGACPECRGFGRVVDIDWDLVVPDRRRTLAEGAVAVLRLPSFREDEEELFRYCRKRGIPLDRPWAELSPEDRTRILEGDGEWWGVRGLFDWLESRRYKAHVRILLSRYRAYRPCPACRGTRFRPEALVFRLLGRNLAEFYALTVGQAADFAEEVLRLPLDRASRMLAEEVHRRLGYLNEVGLSYLTLDRQSRTLSGGEVARVMLTRALASELVETLYLLDEPTTGLHPRDTERVVRFVRRLASRGNTVVVVEHDPGVVLAADLVLELGPGAGERGGEALFFGPGEELVARDTPTAEALRRAREPKDLAPLCPPEGGFLEVIGAAENNLRDLSVRFPRRGLTVITGVSGSGKSTLLELVLYRGLRRLRGEATEPPGRFREMRGWEEVEDVVLVDQSPLARSPRANPATYLKVYDSLRRLLAGTPEARERGLTATAFSFNSGTGRCPQCEGLGFEVVEMQFLSDLRFPCPECRGRRFREEVLAVRWRGLNVAEMLDLTFTEAQDFFSPARASDRAEEKALRGLLRRLEGAVRVGLGYLRLGQPLATLSGGEAQRLKIARHLFLEPGAGRLFLLDEPTVGLHLRDVETLLSALGALVEQGNGVVLVEHHLEVVRRASWVVDLGPGGGEEGGALLYQGPPAGLLETPSPTGEWLARYLAGKL